MKMQLDELSNPPRHGKDEWKKHTLGNMLLIVSRFPGATVRQPIRDEEWLFWGDLEPQIAAPLLIQARTIEEREIARWNEGR